VRTRAPASAAPLPTLYLDCAPSAARPARPRHGRRRLWRPQSSGLALRDGRWWRGGGGRRPRARARPIDGGGRGGGTRGRRGAGGAAPLVPLGTGQYGARIGCYRPQTQPGVAGQGSGGRRVWCAWPGAPGPGARGHRRARRLGLAFRAAPPLSPPHLRARDDQLDGLQHFVRGHSWEIWRRPGRCVSVRWCVCAAGCLLRGRSRRALAVESMTRGSAPSWPGEGVFFFLTLNSLAFHPTDAL